MPNKKINQLDSRSAASTDLMIVGDPTNGTAYKSTLSSLPLVPTSRVLTINGVPFDLSQNRAWTIDTLPLQTGNSGKYLTTNGTTASWGSINLTGYVPYTGATTNLNLGEFGLTTGQINYDLSPTGTAGVGVMRWNNTEGTIDLGLLGGNVTLQVGQEQVVRVVNKSGASLNEAAYQVVKITDAQGQRLAVDLAQGNNDANSTDTIGIVTETIPNNQEGFITTSGLVNEINTTGSLQSETWIDGDVIYLSPTIAGAITNIKPTAPNHTVILGYVVYAHAIHGKIFVKCDNGYELGELHNVYVPTPSNNDGIFWNTANSRYQNNSIAGVLGYTPVTSARTIATTSPLVGGGDLSANRTLSIPAATSLVDGYITSTDWTTFNNKVPSTRTLTINGTALDLSADRSWTVSGTNLYNADGTLTANRVLTSNGKSLTILGGIQDILSEEIGLKIQTSSTTFNAVILELINTFTTTGKKYQLRSLNSGDFDIKDSTTGGSKFYIRSNGNISIYNPDQISGAVISLNGNTSTSGGIKVHGNNVSPQGEGIELDYDGGTSYFSSIRRSPFAYLPIIIRGSQIDFLTNGSNAARLTTSGRLLLGTTTDNGNRLQVYGSSYFDGGTIIPNGAYYTARRATGSLQIDLLGIEAGTDNTRLLITDQFNIKNGSLTTLMNITSVGATTFNSSVTASSFIKSGGTSTQYLMADGSVTTGSALIITNRQTASYTLALSDRGKLVEMNVASANTLTIPLNSSIAFPIGTKIDVTQYGAGATTITATSGVTIRSFTSFLKIAGQYAACTLVKIGTDEWYCYGNLIA